MIACLFSCGHTCTRRTDEPTQAARHGCRTRAALATPLRAQSADNTDAFQQNARRPHTLQECMKALARNQHGHGDSSADTQKKQRHRWRLDFAPVTGHEICLVGVELWCPGIQSIQHLASRPCTHSAPCERAYTGTVHCTNTFTNTFAHNKKTSRHIKVSHASPRSTNATPPVPEPPPPNTHKHNTFDSTPSTPFRACSQRQRVDVRCNGRPTYIYSHLSNVEVQYMCVCACVCVHLYIHCKYIIHTYIHKCDVQIQIYLRCIR